MLEETIQNIILETYTKLYIDYVAKSSQNSNQINLIEKRLTTLIRRYKGK